MPSRPVEAVDTTAAGDAFNGGLAWAIGQGPAAGRGGPPGLPGRRPFRHPARRRNRRCPPKKNSIASWISFGLCRVGTAHLFSRPTLTQGTGGRCPPCGCFHTRERKSNDHENCVCLVCMACRIDGTRNLGRDGRQGGADFSGPGPLQRLAGQRVDANWKNRLMTVSLDERLKPFRSPTERGGLERRAHRQVAARGRDHLAVHARPGAAQADGRGGRRAGRCQGPDGYLGTYAPTHRWGGWDVWTPQVQPASACWPTTKSPATPGPWPPPAKSATC